MFKEEYILNKFNHNGRNNPHPQYDNYFIYRSKPMTTAFTGVRYVEIFSGNFRKNELQWEPKDRQYQRLLYKAYLYSLQSDENQGLIDLNFIAFVDYNNNFNFKMQHNVELGQIYKDIKAFYKTENDITNLKIYYCIEKPYETVAVKPVIYDINTNYYTQVIKCAREGYTNRERLDDLYEGFSDTTPLDIDSLNAITQGYTQYISSQNFFYHLSLEYQANRPTTNLSNGLTIFDVILKKLITYYDGKWYSDGNEV